MDVYVFSDKFPPKKAYSLTSQLRRASISIPANIAEDFKKSGNADKARFLNIAQGSLEEVRYYLILAEDLGYGETENLQLTLDEVGRLLYAYRNAVISNSK